MSCQIKVDNQGNYNVTAPNGEESILFQTILNLPEINNNQQDAIDAWMKVYTPSFKEWYGKDWENLSTEETDKLIQSGFLDFNGEPKIFYRGDIEGLEEFNYSPTIGKFGQGIYIAENIKQAESFASENNKQVYPVFLKPTKINYFNDKLKFLKEVAKFNNTKFIPTEEEVKIYVEATHLDNTTIIGEGVMGKEYNTFSTENVKTIFTQSLEVPKRLLYDNQEKVKLDFNEDFQKKRKSEQFLEKLSLKLKENLGLTDESVQIITELDAEAITKNSKNPYRGQPAFFYKGNIYFIRGKMSYENVLHEFAHPLIEAISIDNPGLFDKLYNEIIGQTEGKKFLSESFAEYPELNEDDIQIKKEVLVKAMTYVKLNNEATLDKQPTSILKQIIDKILYAIKQVLRKINSNPVNINKLSLDTSILDLSNMLIDKTWNLDMSILSNEDIVSYIKSTELQDDLNTVFTRGKGIIDSFKTIDELKKTTKQLLKKAIDSNDYETIKYILSNVSDEFIIEEIDKNLSKVSESTSKLRTHAREQKVKKATSEEERLKILAQNEYEEQAEAEYRNKIIANNLVNIYNVATKTKKYIDSLVDAPDQVTAFNELKFYDQVLSSYSKQLKSLSEDLKKAGLEATSQIRKDIQSILLTVDDARSSSAKIKENYLTEILTDKFNTYNSPEIEKTEKLIEEYKEKRDKASSKKDKDWLNKLIKVEENKMDSIKLAPETMRKFLKGQMGDVGYISTQFENFISSQDPSIATFVKYVKENNYIVAAEVYEGLNKLLSEIKPLTDQLGIKPDQLDKFSDLLLFKDKTTKRNKDTGELETYEVYTFLNENQNYKNTLNILYEALRKAKELVEENPSSDNKQKLSDLNAIIEEHLKLYFKNKYVDEFYQADEELLSTPLGREAKSEAIEKYEQVLQFQTLNEDVDVDTTENYETAKLLLKEYKALFSLVDDYGVRKEGDALIKAQLLIQNRNAKRKFYEYVEIPNAFLSALKGAEAKIKAELENEGLDPILNKVKFENEFKLRRQTWINNNTRNKNKDEFYTIRKNIYDRLTQIYALLPDNNNTSLQREELLENLQGRRDEDGQPIAPEMTPELIANMKRLQEEIEEDRQKNPTSSDALPVNLRKELSGLFALLDDIQETQATSYYIDIVNEYYRKIKEKEGNINIKVLNAKDVDLLLDTTYANELKSKDPEFEKWFNENHILKTRYYKNQIEQSYERVKAWSIVKPKNKKYIETTNIYDDNGILIETIEGIPTNNFYERRVKDQYRTGYNSSTGKLDPYANYDIQRYQLPKSLEEMSLVRDKYSKQLDEHNEKIKSLLGHPIPWNYYINTEFLKLKEENNTQYQLLKLISDYHLKSQENLDSKKTLGYELPRERMDRYQYLTSGSAIKDIQERATEITKGMLSIFGNKEDDFEQGVNYNEGDTAIGTEVYINEDGLKIPIRGKYDLDIKQVSNDVLNAIFTYNYSATENKMLNELQPMAIALRELANDNNPIKFIKQKKNSVTKTLNVINKLSYNEDNNRAHLINGIVEVLFEGKGLNEKSNNPTLVKMTNTALKLASHSFFALDIPSALKNYFSAQLQVGLEAVGGKYYTYKSWLIGRPWALKTMTDISRQIYSQEPKGLNVQLVDYFDAIQGRNQEKFGTSPSRSFGRDVVNATWLTSTRKWLESQATLQIFSAIMHDTKIMQNGKEIRYIDAFELDPNTNIIKLKDGIDKSWDIGGINFVQTKAKIHEVSGFLQGLYASEEQGLIHRNLIFRNIGALKKYFTKMFMHRFAAKGMSVGDMKSWFNPQARLNLATGQSHMGFYMQNILTLNKLIQSGGKHLMYMTPEEIRGFKMGAIELLKIQLLMYLQVLLMASFGTDPDDEKRWSKIAKQTGALPTPLTAEKYSDKFNMSGWLRAHLLLLTMNVEMETKTFVPKPGYGLKDIYNTVTGDESIAMTASYENILNMVIDMHNTIFEEDPVYKKDVGALNIHQEGRNKFWKKLYKNMGVSGKTIDPITTAKNIEQAKKRN